MVSQAECRTCGHSEEAHTHYHDKRYCGLLGCKCRDFRKRHWWNRKPEGRAHG